MPSCVESFCQVLTSYVRTFVTEKFYEKINLRSKTIVEKKFTFQDGFQLRKFPIHVFVSVYCVQGIGKYLFLLYTERWPSSRLVPEKNVWIEIVLQCKQSVLEKLPCVPLTSIRFLIVKCLVLSPKSFFYRYALEDININWMYIYIFIIHYLYIFFLLVSYVFHFFNYSSLKGVCNKSCQRPSVVHGLCHK